MSEPSWELSEWLDATLSEGNFQSEGTFSIKGQEAWEKLAAFALPVEEGWVLKIVQAVSLHPRACLKISQNYYETRLNLVGFSDCTREVLEEAIFHLDTSERPVFAHLAVAVRYLAQLRDRPFSIRYPNGEHVVWVGEGFETISGEMFGAPVPGLHLSVSHLTFEERRNIHKATESPALEVSSRILLALRDHCHLTPRPIELENHTITHLKNDPDHGAGATSVPLGLVRLEFPPGLPKFKLATKVDESGGEVAQQLIRFGAQSTEEDDSEELPVPEKTACSVALLVSADPRKRTSYSGNVRILWVSDGVVVHRERVASLPSRLSLGIVVSARDLATDLTGLVPRESEDKSERARLALRRTWEYLKERDGSDLLSVKPATGKATLLTATGAVALIKVPMVGAALLTCAGVDYLVRSRQTARIEAQVMESYRALVQVLEAKRLDAEEESSLQAPAGPTPGREN